MLSSITIEKDENINLVMGPIAEVSASKEMSSIANTNILKTNTNTVTEPAGTEPKDILKTSGSETFNVSVYLEKIKV